jgi:hypothetical protein
MYAELGLWETNWKQGFKQVTYDSVADTLGNCNELAFPNIFNTLKILTVVPVTTCECERSVSALRQMKTWLRSMMVNKRLNELAQMHINNDITINVEEVINTLARQNPKRMQFFDILPKTSLTACWNNILNCALNITIQLSCHGAAFERYFAMKIIIR